MSFREEYVKQMTKSVAEIGAVLEEATAPLGPWAEDAIAHGDNFCAACYLTTGEKVRTMVVFPTIPGCPWLCDRHANEFWRRGRGGVGYDMTKPTEAA